MRFIYTKTFVKLFTIFVLLALLVIFDKQGYLGSFKDGYFRVYGTMARKLNQGVATMKTTFGTFFIIKNLASENAKLSQQVDELSFANARLKSTQDENLALRRTLNFRQASPLNLVAVEVLASDPTGFTQTIVIDKGQNHDLRINQPIVVSPGILVGKITQIYPDSAAVTLITDPEVIINAEAVDSGAKGLIRGQHGLALAFDLVTQNELIKTGDDVITSGLSEDFPRGLLIGEISSIRSTGSDLFQKAFVSPAADLRNLRFLFAVQ